MLAVSGFHPQATGADAPARTATDPEIHAALQVLALGLESQRRERDQPGLAIAVVVDQELLWQQGFGQADLASGRPVTPQTRFRIGSISKLFTATAILQLRDAGRLQLQDRVANFLPGVELPVAIDATPITIEQLLTHTAGFPRESTPAYWNEADFPTRDEMLQALRAQRSVAAPDTEVRYSNLGYAVAGEIVARASGKSYVEFVEARILQPLGMTATAVTPRADTAPFATGYGPRLAGRPREVERLPDAKGLTPAGNFSSTVADLGQFVSLQFRDGPVGGAQILKTATLRSMHRVRWLQPDWQRGQGLGFYVRLADRQTRIGHAGSMPGFRALLEFEPKRKLGVVVLTNANDGEPSVYLEQAFAILGPLVERLATQHRETSASTATDSRTYVGTYAWKELVVHVMELEGALTVIRPNDANPWQSRVVLERTGEHLFRERGNASGEPYRFELDSRGRAIKLWTDNFYRLRTDP